MRKIKLETDKYYHVYNRGAGKQDVFLDEKDYLRWLWKMWEFNNDLGYNRRDFIKRKLKESGGKEERPSLLYKRLGLSSGPNSFSKYLAGLPKLVEIICYSLLPNHYHFILKQLVDDGIQKFMHKLATGYGGYFNNKHNHSGILFQGPFQAYPINNEGKLCFLSAYVNCNYEIHKLGKAGDWEFCSYRDYLGLRDGKLINKDVVLELFNNNIRAYKKYCEMVIKESQDKKKTEKMLME